MLSYAMLCQVAAVCYACMLCMYVRELAYHMNYAYVHLSHMCVYTIHVFLRCHGIAIPHPNTLRTYLGPHGVESARFSFVAVLSLPLCHAHSLARQLRLGCLPNTSWSSESLPALRTKWDHCRTRQRGRCQALHSVAGPDTERPPILHLCIYMYMNKQMYVCMYVCMYVHRYRYMYVYMYLYLSLSLCIHMYIHIYT